MPGLLDLEAHLAHEVNDSQLDLFSIPQQLPRFFIVISLALLYEQVELVMHMAFEVTVAVVVLLVEGHTAYLEGIVQWDQLRTAVCNFNLLVLLLKGLYFLVYVVSPRCVTKIEDALSLFVLVV